MPPPHPLAGFGRVSETKPDVFRWHKCQEPLFQNGSPSPSPAPPPPSPREQDVRLSSKGLSGRCCRCRHAASLNCDYNGIIAYRRHQIAVRGLDARFRQSGCRSVGRGTLTRHLGEEICCPGAARAGAQSREADQRNVPLIGRRARRERALFEIIQNPRQSRH